MDIETIRNSKMWSTRMALFSRTVEERTSTRKRVCYKCGKNIPPGRSFLEDISESKNVVHAYCDENCKNEKYIKILEKNNAI